MNALSQSLSPLSMVAFGSSEHDLPPPPHTKSGGPEGHEKEVTLSALVKVSTGATVLAEIAPKRV